MTNPDDNPFWGEPTPTDLWDDMDKLNGLYEELEWDHTDYLEFAIEGNHITTVSYTHLTLPTIYSV